ncbi:YqgE/AlgH family protein [Motilibacter aurantiacus]|uniref:YqgE/AlgH family protein n=1 Tax=Motilibacter aurantiacus TaxID=2714955 RepID=UPI0014093FA1|nr:YqgE/AlgH family protein [Motilibacter aurantiacus]NHC45270.1 YqgE/AlgH family protein [Motilibacter aurantiacus]
MSEGAGAGAGQLAGRLLVAAPALVDPSFAGSVVLVLDHDGGGALGVVLNRPTDVPVADALPSWAGHMSDPSVVFRGGPVALDSALALALLATVPAAEDPEPLGWRQVVGALGLVDLDAPPEILASRTAAMRVFAGYAGWGSGQLEGELAADAWLVVDSLPGDAFSTSPEGLWRAVLRRQTDRRALLSTMPEDPSRN